MNSAMLGYFAGSFLTPFFIAAVWLLFCRVTPLKKSPGISYGIAASVVLLVSLLSQIGAGYSLVAALGQLLNLPLLFWGYKRAVQKSQQPASSVGAI